MKRNQLTGWKRMAAFAMALTLTIGDGASVNAAVMPQTDAQTVTETTAETEAAETALKTEQEQTETESEAERVPVKKDSEQTKGSETTEVSDVTETTETAGTTGVTKRMREGQSVDCPSHFICVSGVQVQTPKPPEINPR